MPDQVSSKKTDKSSKESRRASVAAVGGGGIGGAFSKSSIDKGKVPTETYSDLTCNRT
jgi:hypothetical protein